MTVRLPPTVLASFLSSNNIAQKTQAPVVPPAFQYDLNRPGLTETETSDHLLVNNCVTSIANSWTVYKPTPVVPTSPRLRIPTCLQTRVAPIHLPCQYSLHFRLLQHHCSLHAGCQTTQMKIPCPSYLVMVESLARATRLVQQSIDALGTCLIQISRSVDQLADLSTNSQMSRSAWHAVVSQPPVRATSRQGMMMTRKITEVSCQQENSSNRRT